MWLVSQLKIDKADLRRWSGNSIILEIIQIRPRNRRISIHVIDFLNRTPIRQISQCHPFPAYTLILLP
jgi:hypothetical protein